MTIPARMAKAALSICDIPRSHRETVSGEVSSNSASVPAGSPTAFRMNLIASPSEIPARASLFATARSKLPRAGPLKYTAPHESQTCAGIEALKLCPATVRIAGRYYRCRPGSPQREHLRFTLFIRHLLRRGPSPALTCGEAHLVHDRITHARNVVR